MQKHIYYQHYSLSFIISTIIFILSIGFVIALGKSIYFYILLLLPLLILLNTPIYYTIENDNLVIKKIQER